MADDQWMDDHGQRLEQQRQETLDRLARLTENFTDNVDASRDSNADDEHDPEGSTIAFERSQLMAMADQAHQHLAELDAAIGRIEAGTYGTCEQCGRDIPTERLEARPVARTCITCAAAR